MRKRNKVVIGVATLALAGGVTGGTLAIASSSGGDKPVTGPDADAAKAAAVQAVGAGSTAGTVERDDEHAATWEVEVAKADGTKVDVRLDSGFKVVVIDSDDDQGDEDNGADGETADD